MIQELLEAMPSAMDQAAVVTHAMNEGETAVRSQSTRVEEVAATSAIPVE